MDDVLAYFITFTCFGTWLHGDERGSVNDDHNMFGTPFLPQSTFGTQAIRAEMTDQPYSLNESRRTIVLHAVREICVARKWDLLAAHVRGNHVHTVVRADKSVERVMNDFKAAASKQLNLAFPEEVGRKRWTRHGSTRYLWTEEQ